MPPKPKKFVLIGGHVGTMFVTSLQLARIHGLDRTECILANSEAMLVGKDISGMTVIRPTINTQEAPRGTE